MGFMEPQIEYGEWAAIDGDNGTTFVPMDVIGSLDVESGQTIRPDSSDDDNTQWEDALASARDYYDGNRIESIEVRVGWGARLSAPGYMDCTEWSVFETEQEARDYLSEELGDDETEDDCDA